MTGWAGLLHGLASRAAVFLWTHWTVRPLSRLHVTAMLFYAAHGRTEDLPPTIQEVTTSSLGLIADAGFPWTSEEIEERLSEGHRLYALTQEGVSLCAGWVSEVEKFWIAELPAVVEFPCTVSLFWDYHTPPKHRGRHAYATLLEGVLAAASNPAVIYCTAGNVASQRGIRRAGFTPWAVALSARRLRLLLSAGQSSAIPGSMSLHGADE